MAVFGHLTEPEPAPPKPLGDDVFQAYECPAADERDVRRVEADARLGRVLVVAIRLHRGNRAFEELQEGVLDTLPQILEARATSLDLVDLVDADGALLGDINIAVGCQDQPGEQALNVVPDVPSLGRARRIDDDEGDIEIRSQASDQVRLPEPERPISRVLLFSIRTLCKSGSAMIGSGAVR